MATHLPGSLENDRRLRIAEQRSETPSAEVLSTRGPSFGQENRY